MSHRANIASFFFISGLPGTDAKSKHNLCKQFLPNSICRHVQTEWNGQSKGNKLCKMRECTLLWLNTNRGISVQNICCKNKQEHLCLQNAQAPVPLAPVTYRLLVYKFLTPSVTPSCTVQFYAGVLCPLVYISPLIFLNPLIYMFHGHIG